MHGDEYMVHSFDGRISSSSNSELTGLGCCNLFRHLEVPTSVDLLNSWSGDGSSEVAVTQFGDEKTNQLGPTTPVLRSALRTPTARSAPVSPASTKQVTFQTPAAAADLQQVSRNLMSPTGSPRKTLQKLDRFRILDFDVSKISDPNSRII